MIVGILRVLMLGVSHKKSNCRNYVCEWVAKISLQKISENLEIWAGKQKHRLREITEIYLTRFMDLKFDTY